MTGRPPSDWEIADRHIREVLAIELAARDKALQNQAVEYERRLEILNHENARVAAATDRAVSMEKFEGFLVVQELQNQQTREFITATQTRTSELAKESARLRTTVITWITIASFVLALAIALLQARP